MKAFNRKGFKMTKEENQVLKFLEYFHHVCLEQRDIRELELLLHEAVTWTGTGVQGTKSGRQEVLGQILETFGWLDDNCQILRMEFACETIAEGICPFSGECHIRETGKVGSSLEFGIRVTGICTYRDKEVRLLKMHYSFPGSMSYGSKDGLPVWEDNTRVLRRLVGVQSRALEETNRNLNALIQNVPGGVICCTNDEKLELLYYSDGFLQLFGYTREEMKELFDNEFRRMIVPEDLEAVWPEVHKQLAVSNRKEIEYRVRCKDGSLTTIQDRGQLVERDGQMVFYCILIDVTQNRAADEALRMSLERYQIIFNQISDIMFEWDLKTDTMAYSPNWYKKFGYPPMGGTVAEAVSRSVHLHPDDKRVSLQMREELLSGMPYSENSMRIAREDGTYIWCRIQSTLQRDLKGRPARVIGIITDVDKEMREREKLKALAQQDSLTGIYNRGAVQAQIQRCVVSAAPDDWCALLILDVDNFKQINDVYGHLSGDVMLKDIAAELKNIFPHDSVIGRVGGDEFAVLLCHVKDKATIEQKADQVLLAFRRLLPGGMEAISCSIGIAIAPEDGRDFTGIYKAADLALYQAKRQGKNRYSFYKQSCLEGGMTFAADRDPDLGEDMAACCSLVGFVFGILSQGQDIRHSVNQVLELVGRQMGVSRAYIFENKDDDKNCANTFEWCNDGIAPQMGLLQDVPIMQGDNYYDNFDDDGVFYCKDITKLNTRQRILLESQGIQSMLQCSIMDGDKARGFVGFDECTGARFWTQVQINMLQVIARILGVYLLKDRLNTFVADLQKGYRSAIEGQKDWFYVIDPETYQFLYINEQMKREFPGSLAGKACYEVFFNQNTPCENCPARLFDECRACASHAFWNDTIKKYLFSRVYEACWYDGKKVYMAECSPSGEAERAGHGEINQLEDKSL